jgi:RNA-splicing ligase RtcB
MIKKEMISELTSQCTNAENDDGQPYNYDTKTINNLISQSNQQIDKAVNHSFDTYLKDKELDVLYNLEDDWF